MAEFLSGSKCNPEGAECPLSVAGSAPNFHELVLAVKNPKEDVQSQIPPCLSSRIKLMDVLGQLSEWAYNSSGRPQWHKSAQLGPSSKHLEHLLN